MAGTVFSLLLFYQATMGPRTLFLYGNHAANKLARRGALLVSSTMPCKHVSTLLFSLFSNWRYTASSKFFDIQVPLISTEERMFPLHACCILSRHCRNGHSLLLSSYPQYKVWFESECIVVDLHQISTSEPAKRGKKDVKPTFFFFIFL